MAAAAMAMAEATAVATARAAKAEVATEVVGRALGRPAMGVEEATAPAMAAAATAMEVAAMAVAAMVVVTVRELTSDHSSLALAAHLGLLIDRDQIHDRFHSAPRSSCRRCCCATAVDSVPTRVKGGLVLAAAEEIEVVREKTQAVCPHR